MLSTRLVEAREGRHPEEKSAHLLCVWTGKRHPGDHTRAFENPGYLIRYFFYRSKGRERTVSAKTEGGFRETSLVEGVQR